MKKIVNFVLNIIVKLIYTHKKCHLNPSKYVRQALHIHVEEKKHSLNTKNKPGSYQIKPKTKKNK